MLSNEYHNIEHILKNQQWILDLRKKTCVEKNTPNTICNGEVESYRFRGDFCFSHRPYTKSVDLEPVKYHYGAPVETDLTIVFYDLVYVLGFHGASKYFDEFVLYGDEVPPLELPQHYHKRSST